jgi:hypothetical protein
VACVGNQLKAHLVGERLVATEKRLGEHPVLDPMEHQRRDLQSHRPVLAEEGAGGIYVRSAYGPGSAWYRAATGRREGRISAGRVEKDVAFEDADHDLDDQVDAAYGDKYGSYASILDSMITPEIRATTIRLVPQ